MVEKVFDDAFGIDGRQPYHGFDPVEGEIIEAIVPRKDGSLAEVKGTINKVGSEAEWRETKRPVVCLRGVEGRIYHVQKETVGFTTKPGHGGDFNCVKLYFEPDGETIIIKQGLGFSWITGGHDKSESVEELRIIESASTNSGREGYQNPEYIEEHGVSAAAEEFDDPDRLRQLRAEAVQRGCYMADLVGCTYAEMGYLRDKHGVDPLSEEERWGDA